MTHELFPTHLIIEVFSLPFPFYNPRSAVLSRWTGFFLNLFPDFLMINEDSLEGFFSLALHGRHLSYQRAEVGREMRQLSPRDRRSILLPSAGELYG